MTRDIFPDSVKRHAAFVAVKELMADEALRADSTLRMHSRVYSGSRTYDVIRQHTQGDLIVSLRFNLTTGDYLLTRTRQVTYRTATEYGRRYTDLDQAKAVLDRYIDLLDYSTNRSSGGMR